MTKQILTLSLAILTAFACNLTPTGDKLLGETIPQAAPTPTPLNIQNIQISSGSVLPPYGLKVKADLASFRLSLSSDKEEADERLADIQNAIDQIAGRAAEDERVELGSTSINQLGGSPDRGVSSEYTWSAEASAVILNLTTPLTGTNDDLLKSLVIFNDFLKSLNLPETITLQARSLGAEISDPEAYRAQLVAKVYQELEGVQAEYGKGVKFEITNLHGGLRVIALSDTDYYLYLDPAIVVREF